MAKIETDHEAIEIDRSTFFERTQAKKIQTYREYALGAQLRTLTPEQELLLEALLGNDFADNVCHQIIAEDADRLELLRFQVEDTAVQEWLDDWWTRVNLDDESGETHYAALRDGNYAVSLSYSEEYERVCIHREPWWNGQSGVFIAYDAQGEPLYAVKDWQALIDGMVMTRRIVWYEDRLERYVSEGGGGALGGLTFSPYPLPGESHYIQPWEKADGSPLHIPIIHFANSGRGPANYGVSELAGGVIGFQDQINDLQYDISAAARLTAFQMLTATGMGDVRDEDGNPTLLEIGPGKILRSETNEARFGVLPSGDMSQLIAVYNEKMRAVSRMTRTPLHSITGGDWPSGEALGRAEMPLVGKCQRQIKKFTAAWQTVAHRATEIANVYQKANLNEDANIAAIFGDPRRPDKAQIAKDNLAFWQAAQAAVTAGCPIDLYLKREGWEEDEVSEYMERKAQEDAEQEARQLRLESAKRPVVVQGSADNQQGTKSTQQAA